MSRQPTDREERARARRVDAERESLQQRISHWLDLPLAILALVWAGLVVVELAVALPPDVSRRILQVDLAIWVIFALDFFVELALAPNKTRYLKSNVLAAISIVIPFARAVRILRLGVVLRSVSLARIVLISNRATRAAADLFSQNRFEYVLSLIVISVLLAAAGVFFFERGAPGTPFTSFGESFWWAAAMATTINVGTEPVTAEGRIIALLLRVVALAVFGYVTASIASFLVERRVGGRYRRREEREVTARLAEEVERLRATVDRMQERPRAGSAPDDHPAEHSE